MISVKAIKPTDVPKVWVVIFEDENGIETIESIFALDYEEASLKVSNILFRFKKANNA